MSQRSPEQRIDPAPDLRTILHIHFRSVRSTLVLVLSLLVVMLVAMTTTLLLAGPSLQSLAATAAGDARLSTGQLLLGSSWSLLVVVIMFAAGIAYVGMILRSAHATHSGQAMRFRPAWRATIRRMPQAGLLVIIVGASVIGAVAAAPIISLVALLGLLATPLVRRWRPAARWPATKTLAWLAIPLLATVIIGTRLGMAMPEAFLTNGPWRQTVRTGWARSSGQIRQTAQVMAACVTIAMAGTWALSGVAILTGSRWFATVLELSSAVVFAPMPFVGLLVLFRTLGGTPDPLRSTSPRNRPSPVMASLLAMTMLMTLVIPSASPAQADPGLTATEVTIDTPVADETWTYGDAPQITGSVAAVGGGSTPQGTVRLWIQVGPSGSPDSPVEWADVTLDGGTFTFDEPTIPARVFQIWVTYDGDDDHQPSESLKLPVDVERRELHVEVSLDVPADLTVGDTVRVIAEIEADDPAHDGMFVPAPLGELEFGRYWGTNPVSVMGTAPLVLDDDVVPAVYRAEFDHLVTDRQYVWYFNASAPSGETNYIVFQIQQHHLGLHVNIEDIIPAASSVELLAPAEVEHGGEATFRVEVSGPPNVPANGQIAFEHDDGGAWTEFSSGHSLANGIVEITFCAGIDDDVCAPGGLPRLPFTGEEAEPLTIRAEYLPAGRNTDPTTNALIGSTSTGHTLQLDNLGIGACKAVELSPRIVDETGRPTGYADPQIITASNCEDGGYLGGTAITIDAMPNDGFELVQWRMGGLEVGTAERVVLRLPADDLEHERIEIYYQPVCRAIHVNITGSGRVAIPPVAASNPLLWTDGTCERDDGVPGARHMSEVFTQIWSELNPSTNEYDVLYGYGPMPVEYELVSGSPSQLRFVRHSMTFTVDRDLVIPFEFGPVCRAVVTPSTERGGAQLLTAPNCAEPDGTSGYTRNSTVTAAAQIEDETSVVLAGWLLNGVRDFGAGVASQATFQVGAGAATTIELDFATCHGIDLGYEAPNPLFGGGRYSMLFSPRTNCFDNSDRWLEGTEVTLTPWRSGSYQFSGWMDADGSQNHQVRGTVDQLTGVRRVALDETLATTAHFHVPDLCSSIRVLGVANRDDVHFPDSGCGPGYYLDDAKREIARSNDPISRDDYTGQNFGITSSRIFWETPLIMEIRSDNLLAATGWISMRQEFEQGPAWNSGPPAPIECDPPSVAQNGDGSWSKTDITRCYMMVRGDVTINLRECQGLEPTVSIVRADDESGRVFRPNEIGLRDHVWIAGNVSRGTSCAHPDAADTNLWIPDREVTLRAHAPAFGFEFVDWGHVDFDTGVELFIGEDPREGIAPLGVNVMTNDARPTIRAEVNYRAHCAPLTMGHSIHVIDSPPNCPGNRVGEHNYLVGSFVQVAANHTYGGRNFERFRGVIANSTGADEEGRPSALVLIKGDNHVSAHYPNGMDRFVSALGTVGKPLLGVATLAALAGVSIACPPCGVALTALTASVFLLDLIPGIGGMASAALDLVNPLSILECTARWGFGTTGNDGASSTVEGVTATAATTIRSVRFAYEASTEGTERAVGTISARTTGRLAGSTAQFAYGLYEHRIDQIDLDYQTTEDLRDTATWNNCLNEKYRAVA